MKEIPPGSSMKWSEWAAGEREKSTLFSECDGRSHPEPKLSFPKVHVGSCTCLNSTHVQSMWKIENKLYLCVDALLSGAGLGFPGTEFAGGRNKTTASRFAPWKPQGMSQSGARCCSTGVPPWDISAPTAVRVHTCAAISIYLILKCYCRTRQHHTRGADAFNTASSKYILIKGEDGRVKDSSFNICT